jgi:hypothetical protein
MTLVQGAFVFLSLYFCRSDRISRIGSVKYRTAKILMFQIRTLPSNA